jgi:CopG family nickel-responsive transcriptional regulator
MVIKTGVSLPEEVHRSLVELCKVMGYESVSKAIRDAVEMFIAFNKWWSFSGRVAGSLQLLVHRSRLDTRKKLLEIQQSYENIIKTVFSFTVNDYLLCVYIVEGEGIDVKSLYKNLVKINGILAVQVSLVPLGRG